MKIKEIDGVTRRESDPADDRKQKLKAIAPAGARPMTFFFLLKKTYDFIAETLDWNHWQKHPDPISDESTRPATNIPECLSYLQHGSTKSDPEPNNLTTSYLTPLF